MRVDQAPGGVHDIGAPCARRRASPHRAGSCARNSRPRRRRRPACRRRRPAATSASGVRSAAEYVTTPTRCPRGSVRCDERHLQQRGSQHRHSAAPRKLALPAREKAAGGRDADAAGSTSALSAAMNAGTSDASVAVNDLLDGGAAHRRMDARGSRTSPAHRRRRECAETRCRGSGCRAFPCARDQSMASCSACWRLRVNGRTCVAQRPASTAFDHASLIKTSGLEQFVHGEIARLTLPRDRLHLAADDSSPAAHCGSDESTTTPGTLREQRHVLACRRPR